MELVERIVIIDNKKIEIIGIIEEFMEINFWIWVFWNCILVFDLFEFI